VHGRLAANLGQGLPKKTDKQKPLQTPKSETVLKGALGAGEETLEVWVEGEAIALCEARGEAEEEGEPRATRADSVARRS
jgi:hypothetical protein